MNSQSKCALLIAAALGASSALAQSAPPASEAPKAAEPAKAAVVPVPSAGGLTVFVDPVTGKIRQPSADEIGALMSSRPPAAASTAPLVQRALPGGGFAVTLDSSFDSYVVVSKNADGSLASDCVVGDEKATSAVKSGVTSGAKNVPAPQKKKGALDEM
ncbi:MAG: hypothetical protein ABI569_05905 [Casimicrobiaceae bacterium]